MQIQGHIINDFHIAYPNHQTKLIEHLLQEKMYMVVQDEQKRFYGILTPLDIVQRPGQYVIDCLETIEKVGFDETITSVIHKMVRVHKYVLPVFHEDIFLGVVTIQNLVGALSNEKEWTVNKLVETMRELEEEKQKAQSAEKLKVAILNNISHEIRSPLNGLTGFIEILSSSEISNYEKREYSQIVSNCSQQFLNVVNEIIEISKIQCGEVELNKTGICYASVIIEELREQSNYEKMAMDKHHISIILKPGQEISFFSDIVKIKQILSYVVHNALKFIENGFIEIGYKKENEYVVFYVEDTACGIPEDKQHRVFIAFEKIENERDVLLPGIGLGLTIAKHLVKLLDGDLWFDSVPNVGSIFYIKFPI